MKTKTDPRHQTRVAMMKYLFSFSFNSPNQKIPEKYHEFAAKQATIDAIIQECAPEWPLTQINKIDLAVLRLAIFELTTTDTPPKVVIDEAVELSKEYGSENSSKFVNGVLGTVMQKITSNHQPSTPQFIL
jgi:transcription termination factor NusB